MYRSTSGIVCGGTPGCRAARPSLTPVILFGTAGGAGIPGPNLFSNISPGHKLTPFTVQWSKV